jgi:hypothetical protein
MSAKTKKAIILSAVGLAIILSVSGILAVSSQMWPRFEKVDPFAPNRIKAREDIFRKAVGERPPKFVVPPRGEEQTDAPPALSPGEKSTRTQDQESAAAAKLKEGKDFQAKGKIKEAKQCYDDVITKYPTSKAAEEAVTLYNTLK